MDIEALFLNSFSIKKKPADIFDLIEMAIGVAQLKYRPQFEKRQNKIMKMLLYPDRHDLDDDEEEDDQDTSTLDEEEEDSSVGDEDEVTNVEEEKQISEVGTQQIITAPTNQKPSLKFKLTIKRSVQVAPLEKHNNCNAMEELNKTSLVDKQLDADKKGTRQQSHNATMGSRKKNVPTQVSPPPRVKQLLSDFSFEKQLDGDKQLKKQSHEGFKKMESLPGNKREEQKDCTSALMKSMPSPLRKMNNVATKRVQVAPDHKQLLSDCSPKKQSNSSAITRPMQRKETQSSAVATPMQKETQIIRDTKMKFESSKRKFEERLAEQREAKRRIIMVDFHDMPKPPNDPCASRRHCWNRRRF